MQQLDVAQQPYHTSNAMLALCLHMAGVPWENDHQACKVLYSAAILNKFHNGNGEPRYKDWELGQAVEDAHRTGRRGHVEYIFRRTERLPILLKAFTDQVDEIE